MLMLDEMLRNRLNIDCPKYLLKVGMSIIAGNPVRIEFAFDLNNPINPLISAFSTGNAVGDVAY